MIHQVARLNSIVIKITIHEWVVFMQMENMTFADIDLQLPIIRPRKKIGQCIR